MHTIPAIGIASCLAGNHNSCDAAPYVLRHSSELTAQLSDAEIQLDWKEILQPRPSGSIMISLQQLIHSAASWSENLTRRHQPFVFLGGDHSSAMGIWKGVITGIKTPDLFHLIWVDAHMDAHNFLTSPSGNVHGMPLAALLGESDAQLDILYGKGPHLLANNLTLIGVRSYEATERELLDRLGVCWHSMDTLAGSDGVLLNLFDAVATHAEQTGGHFGVSIDLDGLDPIDAPAVGSPVAGGIRADELCLALQGIARHPRLVGLEIAEFSPLKDHDKITERLVGQLIGALYAIEAGQTDPWDW